MPSKFRSTNVLMYPTFNSQEWQIAKTSVDMAIFSSNQSSPSAGNGFANRAAQMSCSNAPLHIIHPTDFYIDKTKDYRVGVWGFGNGNVEVLLTGLDTNYGDLSPTLSVSLALPAAATLLNGEVASTINHFGGGGTQWPSDTIGGRLKIQNSVTSSNKYIFAAYLIPTIQLPTTRDPTYKGTTNNGGGGTHEGVFDGTNLFTISHTYNQLAKFDQTMSRVAAIDTASYPHDLVSLGSDVWVVCFNGKNFQQFSKAGSMSKTAEYSVVGSRAGIGICTDGTNLFIGAGSRAEGPAIVKFTVATTTQTVLNSTDVQGGTANLPVRFLAGSVWSVHTDNSQVVRINPSTGAAVAINCSIGLIYGIGDDGTLVYANGESGIAVVNPASNAVIKTYPFRNIYGGASNCRVDALGRVWGCTGTGAWMLDHANGQLWEMPQNFLGGPKWVCQMLDYMVLGYYSMPSPDMLR